MMPTAIINYYCSNKLNNLFLTYKSQHNTGSVAHDTFKLYKYLPLNRQPYCVTARHYKRNNYTPLTKLNFC